MTLKHLGGPSVPARPGLEPLARIRIELTTPQEIGDTHRGTHRVLGVSGGAFDGTRLSGDVLPVGADWQTVHADGTTIIEGRHTLRTYDGALIDLTTHGVRHAPPKVAQDMARGVMVFADQYYFRMSCRLVTGDRRYTWLTRSIVVGSGARVHDAVVYDLFMMT